MNDDKSIPNSDPEDEPPPVPMERCFVFFKGGLRANANGRKRFQERFARAGFDIDKIRTFDELEAAMKGSWHIVWSDMQRDFEKRNAGKNTLDHQLIRAMDRCDFDEVERLRERRKRTKGLGLRVVKSR